MSQKRLVLFDYDGVIVDSMEHNLAVAGRAAKLVGHHRVPTRQDVDRVENMSFEDVAREIGLPEEKLPVYARHVYENLSSHADTLQVFPGMAEALLELGRLYTLAIVTTNDECVVEDFLRSRGLSRCFAAILGRSSGTKAENLRRAASMLGFPRCRVYVIGDSVSDIRQAKAAGVKSVAVTWGYHSEPKLRAESPDFVAHTPDEIVDLLAVKRAGSSSSVPQGKPTR